MSPSEEKLRTIRQDEVQRRAHSGLWRFITVMASWRGVFGSRLAAFARQSAIVCAWGFGMLVRVVSRRVRDTEYL